MKSANNHSKLVCLIIDGRRFSPPKKKRSGVSSREVVLGFYELNCDWLITSERLGFADVTFWVEREATTGIRLRS